MRLEGWVVEWSGVEWSGAEWSGVERVMGMGQLVGVTVESCPRGKGEGFWPCLSLLTLPYLAYLAYLLVRYSTPEDGLNGMGGNFRWPGSIDYGILRRGKREDEGD